MHFGHPRTTTAFKNQNLLKIWVFQGFPYTRLGPDLVILSPFWGIKFQNPCKKCPSHGEKNLKIFLFFKNVPNSLRKYFGEIIKCFSFFQYCLAIFCKGFEIFRPKMGPKWLNLVCVKLWKTQNLRKFWFLKVVMVLGCPKCILWKFRMFLKNLLIFYHFSPLLGHFLQVFWNF